MIAGWVAVLAALAYLSALFAIAHWGDTAGRRFIAGRGRRAIYVLGLGVYCTSWTFFGSVGLASSTGFEFLSIYIGPVLVLGLGPGLIRRIADLAKTQNINSVADFVASRYGKSEAVAALVTVIAVVGLIPYVALQLKAISASLETVVRSFDAGHAVVASGSAGPLALAIAVVLAGFAMAFGTRYVDATEHQDGLMLAVATESVIKLIAFLVVGCFVVWGMFDGLGDLWRIAGEIPSARALLAMPFASGQWLTMTLGAALAIVFLPRQFHVTIVENRDLSDIKSARGLFPLYLLAINFFVIPIAIAGLALFPDGAIDRDMTVLALPLQAGAWMVALIAMLGGLSAATAMVIVESVALSIMVSNDLVLPLWLRGKQRHARAQANHIGGVILIIRRVAILLVLALAWAYFRLSSTAALASIGLLSFAAIAQIGPAFLGGLVWRGATARGACAGLIAGICAWAYTLLLPSFATASPIIASIVAEGPWGIALLRPTAALGSEATVFVHGIAWSLSANFLAFICVSLMRRPSAVERLQARVFIGDEKAPVTQSMRLWRATITQAEVEDTVARYIGASKAASAFQDFATAHARSPEPGREVDAPLLHFAEHLLASAIGAASSRLVLSLLLRRRNVSRKAALKLVDEASAAIQTNRDTLQRALDFARQGITVFDRDLRLVCWNREFNELFDLPHAMTRVGIGLEDIVRYNAERGLYGDRPVDEYVAARVKALLQMREPSRLRLAGTRGVIEIRSAHMPDGGVVTTYSDATDQVEAEEAMAAANETLEHRVQERTEELTRLNAALAAAKSRADDANASKTRFLAAASHDILQPLNAARLFTSSLVDRTNPVNAETTSETLALARNVDASLEAVEDILTSLLDISRLDAGAMRAEISHFRIDDILAQLRVEFAPLAREKALRLVFVPCSLAVLSDRRLLRRLLQNLISNAIKYTPHGRVIVGCRRRGMRLTVEVHDTGLGIPSDKHTAIFREFERLDAGARRARGLGLGLSIVERLAHVLDHPVTMRSAPGDGSMFAVALPIGSPLMASVQAERKEPAAQPLATMTIVAIDNEPRILQGMQALLAGWGAHTIVAPDLATAQGLLHAAGLAPDAVIADFHLDVADGIAAISALRTEYGSDLPAALITADRSLPLRDRALLINVPLLNKPVKPAALRALLTQWSVRRGRRIAAE